VWATCLGFAHVEPNDDYHRLGGDSLTAVRIAEQLSRALGVAADPSDLVVAPTPRRLAEILERRRRDGAAPKGVVIEARRGDDRVAPLILLHPIGGTVQMYDELVTALPPSRPLLLVQALPFADGGRRQPDTVEAMVDAYLAELDLPRERPVHFGGASFGGMLAFEAARRWRARGGSAASVLMLDSPAPGDVAAESADDADVLAFMARLMGSDLTADTLRRLSDDARRRRLIDLVATHFPEERDEDRLSIYVDVIRANAAAMSRYRPAPSAAAPVTLLVAETRDAGQPGDPAHGWAPLVEAPLTVATVPGGHQSMLAAPHVAATARAIEDALRSAAAGIGPGIDTAATATVTRAGVQETGTGTERKAVTTADTGAAARFAGAATGATSGAATGATPGAATGATGAVATGATPAAATGTGAVATGADTRTTGAAADTQRPERLAS
jgi:thioesterase domain-containing protein